jgi:hypothetical protein
MCSSNDDSVQKTKRKVTPDSELCWCGWGKKGKCLAPFTCPPDVSLADRKRETCAICGRYPNEPGLTNHHHPYCTEHLRKLLGD